MATLSATASPQLLAANERLLALRAEARQRRPATAAVEPQAGGEQMPSADGGMSALPAHLGWESAALTRVLRSTGKSEPSTDNEYSQEDSAESALASLLRQQPDTSVAEPSPAQTIPDSVTLHPTIATAILRADLAAAGRVWLLLRAADVRGRGWVDIAEARELLTSKTSQLRICGWRQLRNLLQQGQGTFWQRDAERIWLRSPARVAAALGVERVSGSPVALPLNALTDGIGTLRAHLYASFHSGRKSNNPISRQTLERLTAVPARTQREYDKVAGVDSQPNYAIGQSAKDALYKEERIWQHGNAVFTVTDHLGRHGKPGAEYVAWQLPNSYRGCHSQRPKGTQRRINRTLKDLAKLRGQGNGGAAVKRRFFVEGVVAAMKQVVNRAETVYWPADVRWWYVLVR